MLSHISWTNYFTFILCVVLLYYVIIIFLYYKKEFWQAIRSGRIILQSPSSPKSLTHPALFDTVERSASQQQASVTDAELTTHTKLFMAEMNELLEKAKGKQLIKEELLFGLQSIAAQHEVLKGSAFQASLDHVIKVNCENICAIHLSENDVRTLWVR